jgi:hypothetical protein
MNYYTDTLIEVDCMLNGISNPNKIQNIYDEIRESQKLDNTLNKEPFKPRCSINKEILYGLEIYKTEEAMFTFKIYRFFDLFDIINQKMHSKINNGINDINVLPSKKYISATRMKITITSKGTDIAEKVNEIINQYPSKA